MSEARDDNEPSMEEILASIRKIISEDEPAGEAAGDTKASDTKASGAKASGEDDVLELTEVLDDDSAKDKSAKDDASAASLTPDPTPDLAPDPAPDPALGAAPSPDKSEASEDSMEPATKQDTPLDTTAPSDGGLSTTTESAVTSALAGFAGQLAKDKQAGDSVPGGGMTLDALVREAIEPQLKAWLDENLEKVVERVVRDEVRRLARRAEDA